MSNAKKYLKTSITLGLIGAAAALAIGVTNAVTQDTIRRNVEIAQEKALNEVFENSYFSEKKTDFALKNKYLVHYFVAYSDPEKNLEIGHVYYVDGRNAYGEIAMMVGINCDFSIGNISIVTNTQSFADTLTDKYIDLYQQGERDITDVSCGATYGATLIKNMAEAALADYSACHEVVD